VKDVKWLSIREAAPPAIYLPILQPATSPYSDQPVTTLFLAIRTFGDPTGLFPAVRREIQANPVFDPKLRLATQEQLVESSMRQERLLAKLSGFFGVVGLLLAAVGLYGLMSYAVSRRTGEIGIRMALGARPADLIRMVLGETTFLVVAGVTVGTAAALVLTRFVEKFLFGVHRTDPQLTVFAASLLMAVALLAAWLPARRAARVEPLQALRHE